MSGRPEPRPHLAVVVLALGLGLPTPGAAAPRSEGPHDHGPDEPFPDHADDATIEVHGDSTDLRGAGDQRIDVRESQAVHTQDIEEALALTPGLLMTRPGGEGAPMQIFLRGFDARHGQDVAFHADGMPLNQVGNPHGHGLTDLRLAPPEALTALEVRPGAADPSQSDFTVAGSVDLELGLPEPGLLLGLTGGSFGTVRGVVGWRHPERSGTFVIGDLYRTAGYGQNRGGQRGSVLGRVERGNLRITGGVAGSDFDHAGLIRRVDVEEGRLDLYDTNAPMQGAGGGLAWAVGRWRERVDGTELQLTASASRRSTWRRTNFTGFLTDDRRPGESPHGQRGDLLDQRSLATTVHLDAQVGRSVDLPGGALGKLEAGLRGRYDDIDAVSLRLRAVDGTPYRTELDLGLQQTDLGLWVGGQVQAGALTARLGGRAQSFFYALDDRCAALDTWFPGAVTDDVNCPALDRNGVRRRDEARFASGLGLAPRGSMALQLGPDHKLVAGGGRGFRSIEAISLSEGERAPFGELWSADLGWHWTTSTRELFTHHRIVGFATTVARDLVFDEDLGTNIVGGPSTRSGATFVSEIHYGALRAHTSLTATYAVYGRELPPSFGRTRYDRQPGQLIPYVPPLVGRSDVTWTWRAGDVGLRHGLTFTGIAPRPLPLSTWSEPVFTVDAGTEARVGTVEVGLALTNLLGARYALAEYNFASSFPQASGTEWPTRLPSRQISPGPPRAIMVSLAFHPESPVAGSGSRP